MLFMVKERVKYYDTLRALAIIAVVMLHIFKFWPQAEIMHFKVVYFIEITRFGVPTFLLLSGALLLNRKIDLEDFFKRRFTRLIYPFIFYLIPYAILLYVLINYCTGEFPPLLMLRHSPKGMCWHRQICIFHTASLCLKSPYCLWRS